jgi:hypothetical protein
MARFEAHAITPPNNGYKTPETMVRVNDHLKQLGVGELKFKDGLPELAEDGTWCVTSDSAHHLTIAEGVLMNHYGLLVAIEIVEPDA